MLYAVILAGGRGTRFWPLSRRALPKQCLSLDGGPTLIQRTYARVLPIIPGERVLVVTGPEMADAIREQLPDLPAENLLIEPSSRNTAPVAAWTAWEVARNSTFPTRSIPTSKATDAWPPMFGRCFSQSCSRTEGRALFCESRGWTGNAGSGDSAICVNLNLH